jgi:hypothetical protein
MDLISIELLYDVNFTIPTNASGGVGEIIFAYKLVYSVNNNALNNIEIKSWMTQTEYDIINTQLTHEHE